MEFGISKCGVSVMKKGKRHREGIQLPNEERMRQIDLDEGLQVFENFRGRWH